ncbi:multidrug efflux MFS transporter [Streptococcus sp. 27098_8_75]|nr:multidrug efflux MFS transporter [Streptococcus gordonii]MCB6584857.1 multidrug efflux MFS transporter [Streptococcus gordonii]MCB7053790.1 multidrug efflux MFS transporter [Streptococcus gordonii]MCB7055877.1 multidrug efflux MFS transporter [Streptococcus gordonii]
MGNFFVGASLSLVVPFMSLFVEELGVRGHMVDLYAGIAVSSSAMTAAFLSPVWGSLADKYGRKPMMIRAALAMTFTMGGIAFVPSVFWLIVLRLLNGVFSGYVPNSTALIASQAPKKYSGYALGTLSTGVVAGTLMGPLLGGFVAQSIGIRNAFLLVGLFLFIVTLLTIFYVKEDFEPVAKDRQLATKDLLAELPHKSILFALFLTSMVIQMSAQSISPILTLYIRSMGQTDNLIFVSGLIVSAMGVSSILFSSHLGKLGDKIGNHRLLLLALLYSFVIYLFCAWAKTPWELGFLRFLFGMGTGALLPGVSSLLNKLTPKEGISRIFSYNQTFFYIGGVVGPIMGSAIAVSLSYHWVFYVTAGLVLLNFFVLLICFRKYLGVREISAG